MMIMPEMTKRKIEETDYGTFMTMTENHDIGKVQVQDNQILFADKGETIVYKTGLLNDPDMIYRLKGAGARFSGEIVKTQHEKAKKILTDNKEKLDEITKFLYEKETITGE